MIIRILMFPVILLIVLYIVIGRVVPTAKLISADRVEVAAKTQELAEARDKLNRMNSFATSVEQHPEQRDFVLHFVPNNQREEIILSDVSQMAQDAGLWLFSVGFAEGRQDAQSGATAQNRANYIEAKMIATGSYDAFKKFADQLFRIKRLYAFKTFELSKQNQVQKEGEAPVSQDVLDGVVSFTYGYIPGQAHVDPVTFNPTVDFDKIDTVMNAATQTDPLVAEPQERPNPFLP